MPLERRLRVLAGHAVPVVAHADEGPAAALDLDLDAARARVERVLEQLLHDRGRPLHHLARRDLVDEIVGQARRTAPRPQIHFFFLNQ